MSQEGSGGGEEGTKWPNMVLAYKTEELEA